MWVYNFALAANLKKKMLGIHVFGGVCAKFVLRNIWTAPYGENDGDDDSNCFC